MRFRWKTATLGLAVGVALGAGGTVLARELGVREARDAVAQLLGRRSDDVRIKSVSPGLLGNDATVTADIQVTFQLQKDKDGNWNATSVRLADGRWEDVALLRQALDRLKAERAHADLEALAAGIEAYRKARGFYPEADTVRAVVDKVTPTFMTEIVREDPWHQPYYGEVTLEGYRLGSPGPDGKEGTPDDVLYAKGRVR